MLLAKGVRCLRQLVVTKQPENLITKPRIRGRYTLEYFLQGEFGLQGGPSILPGHKQFRIIGFLWNVCVLRSRILLGDEVCSGPEHEKNRARSTALAPQSEL